MKIDMPMQIKRRILTASLLFFIALLGIGVRLTYVQVVEGGVLQDRAFEQHTRDRAITPTRGIIYDRNKDIIAKSASVSTIGVVYAQVEQPEKVASVLAEKLELDYDEVYKKVTKRVAFMRIATKVEKDIADQIRDLNLPGVKVDADSKRYYPYHQLASHVIGFVGKDNQGIIGLEVMYDRYLKGEPGKILMETNGKGERRMEIAETLIEPKDGYHLVTTLDMTLQQYAQQAIEKVVEEKQAERGSIILMNPQNGEIYAMANTPDFDLNEPFVINDVAKKAIWHTLSVEEKYSELNKMWRNFTINDTYEPGSTFKIFTSAMGLESQVVTPESNFECGSCRVVAGRRIKCWRSPRSHGLQTFTEGVQNSCNPVFMDIAERMGAKTFYDYMIAFGFNKKTGIDLPGEAVGILHKQKNIGPVELATMSFGQSFQITPMQLLASTSAMINGGYEITPHFAKEIIDDEGNQIISFEKPRNQQIISEATSETLKAILETVVSEGTGNKSYIPGYRIGGKTATSEKLPRRSGKYIASFLAFAPAENPVVVGLVLIDEPKGVYYGGAVAGPVMKEVFDNALPYLEIEVKYNEKEETLDEVKQIEVPDFIGLTIQQAQQLAKDKGVSVEIAGEGEKITTQLPIPGESMRPTGKIILSTD